MKKFVIASLLASAASGFILAGGPVTAAASETHSNCYTFDSNGNIVPLTANCSQTIAVKDAGQMVIQMPNPCTKDPGTLTLDVKHENFHVNVNGAMDMWVTGTQNGAATFTSADGGPNYSGHNTQWFGEQLNNQNASAGDTINVQLTDALGDTVTFHENDHLTVTPAGAVEQVSNIVVTCG